MADKEQELAINYGNGSALILAGPGSGKTRVLTHHLLYLLDCGIDPASIIVITFTKAAANEMQRRFRELRPSTANQILFGTFHSVFLRLRKDFYKHSNIPDIISNEKRYNLILELTEDAQLTDYYSSLISKYKSNCNESFIHMSEKEETYFTRLYENYNNELKRRSLCDYDDIILDFYKALEDKKFLDYLKERYSYVLIDEFQDINEIQYESIKKIFYDKNVFAVGDEDQSVYAFRGASRLLMKKFITEYSDVNVIELKNNYRTKKSILKPAVNLINHNPDRLRKGFQSCIDTDNENHFYMTYAESENKEIELLKNDINMSLSKNYSCVCLARTNKELDDLKKELKNLIRVDIEYAYKEIANVLCDIINFKTHKSRYFYNRIFSFLEGKGKNYILDNQIHNAIKLKPISFVMYSRNVLRVEEIVNLKYPYLSKVEINTFFEKLLEIAKGADSIENLLQFLYIYQGNEGNITTVDNSLEFMTFHKSKGLEFDSVFIPNLNEGIVPGSTSYFECGIEEERRLLYVAMTRAKKELYLYAIKNEESGLPPSRFIKEMYY